MCKYPCSPLTSSVYRIHELSQVLVRKQNDNNMDEIILHAIRTTIVYHSNSCHQQPRLPKNKYEIRNMKPYHETIIELDKNHGTKTFSHADET